MRLDKYIQSKFDLKSRTYAENLIKTGRVSVNFEIVCKTSSEVDDSDDVKILIDENYASQGAYKLERAFDAFLLDVTGKFCLDVGCSNGGFTDCLLRHGAAKVTAVDVAECALDEDLLLSGKVEFVKANARDLPFNDNLYDFCCSDVSFISQKLVLPEIFRVLKRGGEVATLVKPQFELDRSALNKKGIVKDVKLRDRALNEVISCAKNIGFEIVNKCMSPVRYAQKNIEFLLYMRKS